MSRRSKGSRKQEVEEKLVQLDSDEEPLAPVVVRARPAGKKSTFYPIEVPSDSLHHDKIQGKRLNKEGKEVKGPTIIKAFSNISYNAGDTEPIFKFGRFNPEQELTQTELKNYDDYLQYHHKLAETDKLTIDRNITKAINSDDPPLVFLVVTASGVNHAILYILHEGKFYTVGFGYEETDQELTRRESHRARKAKVGLEKTMSIHHTFERLTGALYTADSVAPTPEQSAKLAWVGYLTPEIASRIQSTMDNAVAIKYMADEEHGSYYLSKKSYVILTNTYCEAAGFLRGGTLNCLVWAQQILGVALNCGVSGTPSKCTAVNQGEFDDISDALNQGDSKTRKIRLKSAIDSIQKRLLTHNICTRFTRELGLCGGSRRGRSIKNKTRRQRK
jgi:hypothetical protein